MSVNRYRPHVLVLPEDDPNRQLANGFILDTFVAPCVISVLPVAGGWVEVLDRFNSDHVRDMEKYRDRVMVLLIDFDNHEERLQYAKNRIPARLIERVFVLGTLTEPEDLRAAGTYESIGQALATDCRERTDIMWSHRLLRHNASELARLRERLVPILFPP